MLLSIGSMGIFIFFLSLIVLFFIYCKRHDNPYKCYFIFGKKGAGKSLLLVHYMLRYQKRGWHIYTDMRDVNIPGVRLISSDDIETFQPDPHSALFLDEVGITFDNRDYKKFPAGVRDFFKYLRKMKCCCYMNSQAFDVDKKIRDTTDGMILQISLGNVISLSRPIIRSVTLTQANSQADSRIADSLRFASIFNWRFLWMPKYYKYFNSLEMPPRPSMPYIVVPGDVSNSDFRRFFHELKKRAVDYFKP